ncbi:CsbD family protein [Rhodococcus sp. NPDC056743]|uniref:CsbD family protein n=1 Tax=Rhodococcus sp. NPDC056743 TaxID=3345934 RepID=UPI0036708D12
MSIVKKFKHKAETAEGVIKKTVGKSVGNEKTEAEGRADQAMGEAKQAGDKLEEAGQKFKHVFKR